MTIPLSLPARLPAQAGRPPAAKRSLKTGTCLPVLLTGHSPQARTEPQPLLPVPAFLLPAHFFPLAVLTGCCGVRMPAVVSPVPAERTRALRIQPSHDTLGAWLSVQAPAHLPALREVPHLERRRGGCRRERGTGHQDEHPEWGKVPLGSAPGPSLTLGCYEQSPF